MKKFLVLLVGLTLAASASAGGRLKQQYTDYATDQSLREVRYHQLYNWQRSTDKAVILWTKPSAAYVLDLAWTCSELRSARATIEIGGVASVRGILRVGDDLIVGQMKCRVSDIRPIDLARMKADRRAYAASK